MKSYFYNKAPRNGLWLLAVLLAMAGMTVSGTSHGMSGEISRELILVVDKDSAIWKHQLEKGHYLGIY